MSPDQNTGAPKASTAPTLYRQAAFAVIAVACCGLAWVGGSSMGRRSPSNATALSEGPASSIIIPASALELGDVWEAKEHVCRLPIRNQSEKTVEIVKFDVSCNCSSVSPGRVTIPAGQASEIQLKIDLTHRLPQQLGVARREFSVAIRPVLNPAMLDQPS